MILWDSRIKKKNLLNWCSNSLHLKRMGEAPLGSRGS